MPDVLPNIPQEPAQGIQALLDTVYLWNPDVANGLIDKVNELLEELGDLTNLGAIKPYAELVAPIPQYLPMSYNNAVYVANEALDVLPETPDLTKWTQIATKVDQGAIETQIRAEENARVAEDAILQGNIDSEVSARAQADTALGNRITAEETARSGADSNLQTQIDAISASSDVKDIVGTHAELEDYDTSTLGDNDIIKVLQDETEEGATTYYRWVAADQEFSLIGEEGPYYTKAQADTLLGQKQNTLTAGEGITIENDVISATASGDFVPQLDVLPTAGASNAGEIAQYSGETIPGVEESATISQTVGSSLTSLSVNLEKFVGAEQPTGNETVDFVALDEGASASITQNPDGETVTITNADLFVNWIEQRMAYLGLDINNWLTGCIHWNGVEWYLFDINVQSSIGGGDSTFWEGIGVEIVGTPTGSSVDAIYGITSFGGISWTKNAQTVELSSYGISYSGTPNNGDTLTVAYTAPVAGITNGYFYKSSTEYTDPVATISQTVGGGSAEFTVVSGTTTISATPTQVKALIKLATALEPNESELDFSWNETENQMQVDIVATGTRYFVTQAALEQYGFVFNQTFANGDEVVCNYVKPTLDEYSVDVETFVEAEQPAQSGNTSFVAAVTQSYISYSPDVVQDPNNYIFAKAVEWFGAASEVSYIQITSAGEDEIATEATLYSQGGGWGNLGNLAEHNVVISNVTAGQIVSAFYNQETTTWSKNGTTVDLADYGISYFGTPANGDTLTVAYTAPVITGYAWNQLNVQPGSGGGNAGIEWKTKVDLPAEYVGDQWSARPYYTITGGLPDGTYEFYFSTKATSEASGPLGEVIFRVLVTIDNTNSTFNGKMGYVFDGNYMNDGNYVFGDNTKYMYSLVYKHNNDTILFCSEYPWASDVFGYITHRLVPECFKLSAIKNVDTGDEYVATGAINLDGSWPAYTTQYGGSVRLAPLTNPTFVPAPTAWTTVSVTDFATKTVFLGKRTMGGSVHLITDGSELIINFTGVGGNEITPYSQEIIRATGIFAGCYLAYGANYIYVMGVDTTTAATLSGEVRCACGGSNHESINIWFDTIPTETLTMLAQFGPQAYRLGTIIYDGLGNIVQYTGATDSNYTNGYFYKATGTVVTIPASITFINVSPSDVTVTVADPDALVTALNNVGSWGEQWVRDRLTLDYTEFSIGYDSDTGTIVRVWWSNYGDIYTQDVFDCFAVSTTGSYTGEISIAFACNRGYAPESKGVQNTAWVQVEVQPNSGGLPDQTGNAGKFLTTDGTDASWSGEIDCQALGNWFKINTYNNGSTHLGLYIVPKGQQYGGATINYYNGALTISGSVCISAGNFYSSINRGYTLGTSTYKGANVYTAKINTGTDIEVPTTGGTMAVQVSSLPTAGSTLEGQIYQYIGATDSTYTNGHFYKCVSDGQDPATYSWEEVSLGGASYTAGTGISIDANNEISVAAPVAQLVQSPGLSGSVYGLWANVSASAQNTYGNTILGYYATHGSGGISSATAIGSGALVGNGATAIGARAHAQFTDAIAIGSGANSNALRAIQIGYGTNTTSDTFQVKSYNLLNLADGTVPTARLTKVNTTVTLAVADWSSNTQTVSVTGMTADGVVMVSPTPANQSAYTDAGILCTAQAAGSLTFTCDTVPSADITVTVVML